MSGEAGGELAKVVGRMNQNENWWIDRELAGNCMERVDSLRSFALTYGRDWLNKYGAGVEGRFRGKYGAVYDSDKAVNYQPNSAWGGGEVDAQILFDLKGISGVDDLLHWAEAIESEYGVNEISRRLVEAESLEECRVILNEIGPGLSLEISVEGQIDGGDENVRGWAGLDTVEVAAPSDWDGSFARVHHLVAHEIFHRYYQRLAEEKRLCFPTDGDEKKFNEWLRVNRSVNGISDEDLARLVEMRVSLRRFEETGDDYYLANLIDAAKFYEWVCFGRVGGEVNEVE